MKLAFIVCFRTKPTLLWEQKKFAKQEAKLGQYQTVTLNLSGYGKPECPDD